MAELSEQRAYIMAVEWVSDEVQQNTCLDAEEATQYAGGFVNGLRLGLTKGAQGSKIIQGDTAEAFWRGNVRDALWWERKEVIDVGSEP
jgi:hypothetical protein